ncbi:uncharacterized protein LOC143255794 isoform X2 [Tachypleus tridentatus]|uniref:uncharacterized protein LOC143255794 isoform X2 n=1 Tax=Tachypleus tridentatus TaxID=6853 RepID=UPI003FCFE937
MPTLLIRLTLQDKQKANLHLQGGINLWFSDHKVETAKQSVNHRVIQCFNCQKFGHPKAACSATARCVRCSEQHQVSDCPKSREDMRCANCQGRHAASYKRCSKFVQVAQIRRGSGQLDNTKSTVSQQFQHGNTLAKGRPTAGNSQAEPGNKPSQAKVQPKSYTEVVTRLKAKRQEREVQSPLQYVNLCEALIYFVIEVAEASMRDPFLGMVFCREVCQATSFYFQLPGNRHESLKTLIEERRFMDANSPSNWTS